MSWESAWQEGRTGWDAGKSPPALVELLRRDVLPRGCALVPGAGAGYDVVTLARHGYEAVGVDVAPTAATRFGDVRACAGPLAGTASLVVGDYLGGPVAPEPVDVLWDYTFFCALPPELRATWGQRHAASVRPGGELVTLVFPTHRDGPPGEGPPYAISVELIADVTAGRFDLIEATPVSESHSGRQGKEILARWRRR